ncbi:MAG: DNA polymerase III subunit alpha [candidate division WOR-3 bacterium]
MKSDFVHLHNHTDYSLLDGACPIEKLMQAAVNFSMPAVAITDHGNMFGTIEFYKSALKYGIKPIIGAEVYVIPGTYQGQQVNRSVAETTFHLTLLCENKTGYKNLIKLISLGYKQGFYYRPRLYKDWLAEYSDGLIALSGCLKGEINQYLLQDDFESAQEALATYQDIFSKDNFYLEITRLGMPETEKSAQLLMRLASEMGVKVVATNDCHYLTANDDKAHDVMICLQTGKKINEHKRLKFESKEIYFKSPQAMKQLFADIPQAIDNTIEIADRCHLLLDVDGKKFFLPAFPVPTKTTENDNNETKTVGQNEFEYLCYLTRQGLRERYHKINPEIENRLNYELKIIARMGFAGYFLIVKDIIDFAHSKSIPIGPGRGSAVSSLVLYTLGITDIDPLKYGLLFERFLNPDRITLPDIDVDFADNRRSEVIDYIKKKYGEDSVAQIITFGTMKSRAVVRDVGRVLDIPYNQVDRLAKLIPFGMEINTAIKESKELRDLIESSEQYQELIQIALKLEGLARHASIHASGVVIAPQPLIEFVPLYRTAENEFCSQYDMDALASVGLLKMDILGLRTLSVIEDTLKICSEQGIEIKKSQIPFDDKKTYQLLQRADTTGLFQIESEGMRDILRRSKPEKIDDLCAVIALYRPGPMAHIDAYINRKLGNAKIEYIHESTKPILKETYGIIVYQEQVMQIAEKIAGFTPTQYDRLRKAMGKKIAAEMEAMRETFIEGAVKNNFSKEKAEEIFDKIAPFAGYGFNKSHSIGYAHLSYLTAYLKANYPLQFMTALLTNEINNSDKLDILIKDLKKNKITVLPPDVNYSDYAFRIEENKIRYGLGGIKNLGEKVCQAIVQERVKKPYQSFQDFLKRTRHFANRKAYEFLIKAGALDSLNKNRTHLLSILDQELEKISSERLQYLERQNTLFDNQLLEQNQDLTYQNQNLSQQTKCDGQDLLNYEKEAFGFYFSCHPLDNYALEYQTLHIVSLAQLDKIRETPKNTYDKNNPLLLAGVVNSRVIKKDRKGQDYAIFKLEDFTGKIEIIAFNETYSQSGEYLKPDAVVLVEGKYSNRDDSKTQIEARAIIPFTQWPDYFDGLVLAFPKDSFQPAIINSIKAILEKYPGPATVYFKVIIPNQKPIIYTQNDPGVKLSKQLISDLMLIHNPKQIKIIRHFRVNS